MADKLLYGLCVYTVLREVYFMYSMHVLLNKCMSNSYYDYKKANKLPEVVAKKPVLVDNEQIEDLNHIM